MHPWGRPRVGDGWVSGGGGISVRGWGWREGWTGGDGGGGDDGDHEHKVSPASACWPGTRSRCSPSCRLLSPMSTPKTARGAIQGATRGLWWVGVGGGGWVLFFWSDDEEGGQVVVGGDGCVVVVVGG